MFLLHDFLVGTGYWELLRKYGQGWYSLERIYKYKWSMGHKWTTNRNLKRRTLMFELAYANNVAWDKERGNQYWDEQKQGWYIKGTSEPGGFGCC